MQRIAENWELWKVRKEKLIEVANVEFDSVSSIHKQTYLLYEEHVEKLFHCVTESMMFSSLLMRNLLVSYAIPVKP